MLVGKHNSINGRQKVFYSLLVVRGFKKSVFRKRILIFVDKRIKHYRKDTFETYTESN